MGRAGAARLHRVSSSGFAPCVSDRLNLRTCQIVLNDESNEVAIGERQRDMHAMIKFIYSARSHIQPRAEQKQTKNKETAFGNCQHQNTRKLQHGTLLREPSEVTSNAMKQHLHLFQPRFSLQFCSPE